MSSRPTDPSTRQRLLDAASRIFARDGLNGATTREISREAGVNEVTLFRHFQSKDRLLAAVVGQNFGVQPADEPVPAAPPGDLRADLLEHARRYDRLLTDNLPLVRTMIGEIHHHHRDQQRTAFKGIFRPLRAALIARLELAHQNGLLRAGVRPDVLADLFSGMIFTGVLRQASPDVRLEYSTANYLKSAVDLVLRGAAP